MTNNPERFISKQIAAAAALRASIAAIAGDDSEAIRDTLEGSTSLHEAIAAVVAMMAEDEMMIDGIGLRITDLDARRARLKTRIERLRATIEQAMVIGEIKTLQLAEATLSLKNTPRQLEIIDEASIPAEYWKPQDPKLDRSAVKAALKGGATVPGATLTNGGVSVSIRRS